MLGGQGLEAESHAQSYSNGMGVRPNLQFLCLQTQAVTGYRAGSPRLPLRNGIYAAIPNFRGEGKYFAVLDTRCTVK